mmetsp:Transcript_14492/g.43809  ORF Transcript_14492/g.43809 Transcript_14492/m.43809 type:complete len:285 (-) Transcript_14492:206-1060(-)
MRSSTSCTRCSMFCSVLTSTLSPNRSSSWGRSSPSVGLPDPIITNLAGWAMETPSRSTVLMPEAALSSTTSTSPSSSRFTSSTYSTPLLALASKPGSKALTPSVSAFSMSMVPHTRSSVAPRGRSTMLMRVALTSSCSPARTRWRTSSDMDSWSTGSLLKGSPATTWILGSRSVSARTVVDLPVPRSPITMTPPIFGSMMLSSKASFICSWPTMAVKGNTGLAALSSSSSSFAADAAGASATAALLIATLDRMARWQARWGCAGLSAADLATLAECEIMRVCLS